MSFPPGNEGADGCSTSSAFGGFPETGYDVGDGVDVAYWLHAQHKEELSVAIAELRGVKPQIVEGAEY